MNEKTNVAIFKGTTDRIWIKVTAHVRQDYGRDIQVPFEIRARVPTVEDITSIHERTTSGEINDSDVAREHVVDWRMPGPDGNEVEFSQEALEAALNHPDYLGAITDGLTQLIFGKEALRIKNSMRSGKPGRGRA